jgi:hypothetical protein
MAIDQDAVLEEVSKVRADFVRGYVNRRIDHRDGDATTEQITEWENAAYVMWRERFPALSEFLIPSDPKAGA